MGNIIFHLWISFEILKDLSDIHVRLSFLDKLTPADIAEFLPFVVDIHHILAIVIYALWISATGHFKKMCQLMN